MFTKNQNPKRMTMGAGLIVVVFLAFFTACGGDGGSGGEGGGGGTGQPGAAMKPSVGLDAGSRRSQSTHYTFEHKLNVNPTDGLMESRHYSMQPSN